MQKLPLLQSLGEVIDRPSYPPFFWRKIAHEYVKTGGAAKESIQIRLNGEMEQ